MSKKIQEKKTKKPDPKAAGERALNKRKIAMEEEALRIRRIVSKMLEPVQERLTALESRSAPAEEWKNDLRSGDIVKRLSDGAIGEVTYHRFATQVDAMFDGVEKTYCYWMYQGKDYRAVVPATEAEIADHKAKEEQRAIAKRAEDERAKEMAKPLEFGTRVKVAKGEGIYLGGRNGRYTIATPHNEQFDFDDYTRDQFQILD